MIIKRVTNFVEDYDYPSKLGGENLYFSNSDLYGSYALEVRTNTLTYEIELMHTNNDIAPLNIKLLYSKEYSDEIQFKNKMRFNLYSFIEKINDNEYKVFEIDNSISTFKYEKNSLRCLNITKHNGEYLRISNGKYIIESLDETQRVYSLHNDKILLDSIKTNKNNAGEYASNYELNYDYDENNNINRLISVTANGETITLVYNSSNIEITYNSLKTTLSLSNNAVTSVSNYNGKTISFNYSSSKLKSAKYMYVENLRFYYDGFLIGYKENNITNIKEGNIVSHFISNERRNLEFSKCQNEYLVKESINQGFLKTEMIYGFNENTGSIDYSYEKDNFSKSLIANVSQSIQAEYSYANTYLKTAVGARSITLSANQELEIELGKDISTTNPLEKDYWAYFIKYEISSEDLEEDTIELQVRSGNIIIGYEEIGKFKGKVTGIFSFTVPSLFPNEFPIIQMPKISFCFVNKNKSNKTLQIQSILMGRIYNY